VDAAASFTNAPHKHVLLPTNVDKYSQLHHYENAALIFALYPLHSQSLYYAGTLRERADSMGVLTGERLVGMPMRPAFSNTLAHSLLVIGNGAHT